LLGDYFCDVVVFKLFDFFEGGGYFWCLFDGVKFDGGWFVVVERCEGGIGAVKHIYNYNNKTRLSVDCLVCDGYYNNTK
jgi:hypothetical protein